MILGLHEASTFQLDKNVRRAATLIGDMQLLGRLSAGDMEAKYHRNYLLKLYHYERACKIMQTMKQTRMQLYQE